MIWLLRRHARLFLFVTLMALIFVTQVAATGQATALVIASAVGVVAPFVLKLFPQVGRYMLIITAVASILIAVVAEVVTGEISLTNLQSTDPTKLYETVIAAFGVSQFVFAYFKDHPLGALAVK
jgi:O-antigen ligase